MGHHLRPDWIQDDIATEFQQMRLLLHQNGGEPALQEMPDPLMATVIRLRIAAIELAHAEGQIRLRRFEEQMIVVIHEAIDVTEPAIPIDHMSQEGQKRGAITVICHNVVPSIAATRDVVDGPREFQTQWTCYGG